MGTLNTRNLVLVLGDQLTTSAAPFDDFDPERDAVWMAEVAEEAEHTWCHKLRIAAFFSAMRHFRQELSQGGCRVHYTELPLDEMDDRGESLAELLEQDVRRLDPERLVMTLPGDYRVLSMLRRKAEELDIPLAVMEDRHFRCGREEFQGWAAGRKELRLADFYRRMRQQHRILVDGEGEPEGGRWSFDVENREAFSSEGPPEIPPTPSFPPDEISRGVLELVSQRFEDHPGSLESFHLLPLTREQARIALQDFIQHRLPGFGPFQDALWTGKPFLYHSRLSVSLNLKLLDPRECLDGALAAYERGTAPLQSVEGFVRQILGWREYIRGIYWLYMPEYAHLNALECHREVPRFFWDGDSDMACVADAMASLLRHGYAHHVQRLMVLGLFALLAGVHPGKFHHWHLAMYADAVDWVSLPNTLGMSQYGDGGIVGGKPYCASGNYIRKMGNYCDGCRYDPRKAVGEDACPFTTLYWDFLARNRDRLDDNPRMGLQLANLGRKDPGEMAAIRTRARSLLAALDRGDRL